MALAVVGTQKRFAGALVVPRLIRRAWLHRREDRHEPGMRTTLVDHLLNLVGLANAALANELDRDFVFGRNALGMFSQLIAQRLGELRIVEDTDLPAVRSGSWSSPARSKSPELCPG
jgi:hypothetical protein